VTVLTREKGKMTTGNLGKLEKRLAAYGSMSLALAAVSMPSAARATEITWSADITTGNGPAGAVYFDLLTGYAGYTPSSSLNFELLTDVQGTSNLVFKARILVGADDAFGNGNMFAVSASKIVGGGASSVAKLSPGAIVGSNLIFGSVYGTLADGEYPYFGHWNAKPVTDNVGLLIEDPGIEYGWATITVNANYTITLHEFGIDESGKAVPAGLTATPEPSSIVLLTLGAAGIAAWRKKKARVSSAAALPPA
jgi:hypothetical protein